MDRSPLEHVKAQEGRVAGKRTRSQRRWASRGITQRVTYENGAPAPSLNLRLKRGKAKRSTSPPDVQEGAPGFLPPFGQGQPFLGQGQQVHPSIIPAMVTQSTAYRTVQQKRDDSHMHTRRRKQSPRRKGLEKLGLVAIDKLKEQALVGRMALEKPNTKPHQRPHFSKRLNSTAGGDASRAYAVHGSLDASPHRPSMPQRDNFTDLGLPKKSNLSRPETQGANTLFTRLHGRSTLAGKHRRIGTVATTAYAAGDPGMPSRSGAFSNGTNSLFGKGGVKGVLGLNREQKMQSDDTCKKKVTAEEPGEQVKDNEQQLDDTARQDQDETSRKVMEDSEGQQHQNLQHFDSLYQDTKLDDATDLAQETDIQPDFGGQIQKRIREQNQSIGGQSNGNTLDEAAKERQKEGMKPKSRQPVRARQKDSGVELKRLVLRQYNQTVMQSFFEARRAVHGAEGAKRESNRLTTAPADSAISPFRDVQRIAASQPSGEPINPAVQDGRRHGCYN